MKSDCIELPGREPIPILYGDRSVLAIDKPRGWMLLPVSWQNTGRNLQAALNSSIAARDFWSRSRGIKFLRYLHRLDGDTSGILLLGRSPGAVETYSGLFESRRMDKTYLAVVTGRPRQTEWTCRLKLAPDPRQTGRMKVDAREGKDAETHFRVLQTCETPGGSPDFGVRRHVGALKSGDTSPQSKPGLPARPPGPPELVLVECKPLTGRTHQIRVHLAESGLPIVGDELYGRKEAGLELGLRAVRLVYTDPFTRRRVDIQAPTEKFLREYGFDVPDFIPGGGCHHQQPPPTSK